MDIKDFLLARVAEDENQAANVSVFVGPGPDGRPMTRGMRPRILAECAAKRAIIEHWGPYETLEGEDLLRTLAAVYSDHPDYRQEWAL